MVVAMTFRFFDGRLDIEIEWDHGPELWVTVYGRRTQIIMLSWNAYPVLKPYTIEDLYRDSPTETPFRDMVETKDGTRFEPRNGKSDPVMDEMMEEYGKLDPELQDKIRDVGRQVERQLFGRDAFGGDPGTGLHCSICGIGVTAPHKHDVDMCGVCHRHLVDLPPITYISDGPTRGFTFGYGAEAYVVVMSYTTFGALQRYEIGYALATVYRRAWRGTAPSASPLRSDEVLPGVKAEDYIGRGRLPGHSLSDEDAVFSDRITDTFRPDKQPDP